MSEKLLAENILTRLEEFSVRYADIELQMAKPEIASNHIRLVELSKERGRLGKLVELYRNYKQADQNLQEALQITDSNEPDADLLELAREELPQLQAHAALSKLRCHSYIS